MLWFRLRRWVKRWLRRLGSKTNCQLITFLLEGPLNKRAF
jgi:hypothetical protein